MMMKMIAIGILALLGLSSVMSPKAFRMFLGGFGACCTLLLVGALLRDRGQTQEKPTNDIVSRVLSTFGKQPTWKELMANTSNEILDAAKKAPTNQEDAEEEGSAPASELPQVEKIHISIPTLSKDMQLASVEEKIKIILDSKLKQYQVISNEIGVDRLSVEDLNPGVLRPIPVRNNKDGKSATVLGFVNDDFQNHVRLEGKKLVMKERLEWAMIASMTLGAILFMGYGVLKVVNRRPARTAKTDYLQQCEISLI